MAGATLQFSSSTVSSISIEGQSSESSAVIENINNDTYARVVKYQDEDEAITGYNGIFPIIGHSSGTVGTENVILKNVKINNAITELSNGDNSRWFGTVFGKMCSGSLTMDNVSINDCSVVGYQKVGGIGG